MQANEVERSLRASRLRTVALTLVLGASLGLLLWATPTWPPARSVSDLARWLRTTPPDAAMTTAAALLGWMCLIWLLGGALLITLSRLPGFVGAACAELAEHITPIVLRRAVNGALGTALVTGSVAVALPAARRRVPPPRRPPGLSRRATDRRFSGRTLTGAPGAHLPPQSRHDRVPRRASPLIPPVSASPSTVATVSGQSPTMRWADRRRRLGSRPPGRAGTPRTAPPSAPIPTSSTPANGCVHRPAGHQSRRRNAARPSRPDPSDAALQHSAPTRVRRLPDDRRCLDRTEHGDPAEGRALPPGRTRHRPPRTDPQLGATVRRRARSRRERPGRQRPRDCPARGAVTAGGAVRRCGAFAGCTATGRACALRPQPRRCLVHPLRASGPGVARRPPPRLAAGRMGEPRRVSVGGPSGDECPALSGPTADGGCAAFCPRLRAGTRGGRGVRGRPVRRACARPCAAGRDGRWSVALHRSPGGLTEARLSAVPRVPVAALVAPSGAARAGLVAPDLIDADRHGALRARRTGRAVGDTSLTVDGRRRVLQFARSLRDTEAQHRCDALMVLGDCGLLHRDGRPLAEAGTATTGSGSRNLRNRRRGGLRTGGTGGLFELHLQVEQEPDRLLLDAVHHRGEQLETLPLVFHERIALAHGPQADALLEVVHLIEVLPPLAVVL